MTVRTPRGSAEDVEEYMLPDFPKVRENANEMLRRWFERHRAAHTGIMREIKAVVMREGNRMRLLRSDGSVDRRALKKMGAAIRLEKNDLDKKGLKAVLEAVQKAAADLGRKQSKFFFQQLHETLEEAGQVGDAGGKPFTFDRMLEALEMVDIDFDEQGQPMWPTFVCGRALYETAQKWVLTDEQKKKHEELTERKRLAWREREGNRRLVS